MPFSSGCCRQLKEVLFVFVFQFHAGYYPVLFVAIALSDDHKPDRSDERERIEQAGGFVIWAGTY